MINSCNIFNEGNSLQEDFVKLADHVLILVSENDFESIDELIHPIKGLRFSPYAYVSEADVIFKRTELKEKSGSGAILDWGDYDGSGDPIHLAVEEYFKRFVYDRDYRQADKKGVNQFIGSGNSVNNLMEMYQGCDFVEYYVEGKSEMDWRCLRVVLMKHNKQYFLVGLVHDEWTI